MIITTVISVFPLHAVEPKENARTTEEVRQNALEFHENSSLKLIKVL